MLRSFARRFRSLFEPSVARLEYWAARKQCSVQALMDIDEANLWFPPDFRGRFGGFHPPGEIRDVRRGFSLDRVRSDMLVLLLREIVVGQIPGAFAELGVHHGWSARLIHHYCPDRRFYLLDTFAGFAAADLKAESLAVGFNEKLAFQDTSVERVRQNIQPIGDTVAFVPGWFPDSATPAMRDDRYAFVHLDADLEAPIAAGLAFFWPRLAPGGMMVVHDYNAWPGARLAVDAFRQQHSVRAVPMPDKAGSVVLLK